MRTSSEMLDLTAVLLCGGKGERLRPLTQAVPKPMVPLNGRPMLHHLMAHLSASGISRFVVCVGYKAEVIEAFVAEEAEPDWRAVCIDSGDASMTDRILDAAAHVSGAMLVCYGDVLANVDIGRLAESHESRSALATVTVHPLDSPFGIVEFDSSRQISRFVEKPRLPYWTNIGFMLFEPEALSHLERGTDIPEFLSKLAEMGVLYAYEHLGNHLTVNTEKDHALAEDSIKLFAAGAQS